MVIVELHISMVVAEYNTPEEAVDTVPVVVDITRVLVPVELELPEVVVGNRLQEIELQGNLLEEADRDMPEEVVRLRLAVMVQDIVEEVADMNS